jgi:anti-sigma B factor antagonist
MPATSYPFQMAGGVPVVTAPAEIDTTTAGQLRAILVEWHTRGHATVVVDMTGTQFCDSAGLNMLVRAHKRAVAEGGELRLVIPTGAAVLLVFILTGIDHVIPRFASLEQALAQVPAAALRRPRPDHPLGSPAAGSEAEAAGSPAEAREQGPVADTRACEQCGAAFVPQREHARFCGVDCRAAWNREHMGDPAVEASALQWSVTAMSEATGRLPGVRLWDQPRALAAVGEAVWWITMVDATLVRHHRDVYDAVMAAAGAVERRLTEGTLAGLRFVRNRIGPETGLEALIDEGAGTGHRRITGWTWKPTPEPALVHLPLRGQAWEMSRYRAYQAQLAGRTIGETLRRAVTFLTLTGADAASATVISADIRP